MNWERLSAELTSLLGLAAPPIGITFSDAPPEGVAAYDAPMPEPTPDGRTGKVPASCVFWMEAADAVFTTAPEDHGNCSVGSLTHGIIPLSEAATRADVGELVKSGWVSESVFPEIPTMSSKPGAITYAPLAQAPVDPDVVMLRVNGKQLMEIGDAVPDMHIGGKPQCHIIPMAAEQGEVAASVGCALSRVRTGMDPSEMTCALPAARLEELVGSLRTAVSTDDSVRTYAAEDKARFG